jgi:molybdopterin/thiamine biosynthesis adenylyltransferase
MNDAQLLRYSRHILLNEWGIEVQEAVNQARVLIIGAGGLGCPAALYLIAAGIGQLTVVDGDNVDLTNLQRQIAHTTAGVGRAKVASLAEAATRLNADVLFRAIPTHADDALLAREVPLADVVLDCTDHFSIRQAINRACVAHRVPLVSGAALRFDGQVTTFDLRRADSPCYACLFPPSPAPEEVSCSTMGVFAPTVGIIGAIQAAEALKLVSTMATDSTETATDAAPLSASSHASDASHAGPLGTTLAGRLLILDSARMQWSEFRMAREAHCPVCSGRH